MGRFYPRLNDTVMTAKKTLQINLKTIPETGLAVAIDLGPEWFARWHEEDPGLEFADARITGDVHLSKHGHDILVRGSLSGQLELACSRCLEPFAAPAAIDFDLLLVPGPASAAAAEEELSPDGPGPGLLYRGDSGPGEHFEGADHSHAALKTSL